MSSGRQAIRVTCLWISEMEVLEIDSLGQKLVPNILRMFYQQKQQQYDHHNS